MLKYRIMKGRNLKKDNMFKNSHCERSAKRQRAKAFTLAEVLITLGIIGIVAAMTLPALIQNHRKHVVETRLEKFYSTMNQAILRAEVDYGDKKDWDKLESGYDEDENGNKTSKAMPWFNKYLRPYLKLTDVKYDDNYVGKVLVYFLDGSMATINSNSIHFFLNAKDYKKIEMENGDLSYNREYIGTKIFTFLFNPNGSGFEPYMFNWDGTEEQLRNQSAIGCNKNATNEPAYCTALIMMNGWKIPKDYPFRF
ncbi:type II secretion system protein [bacterium]|nr:type II secretion system protein [bacterium]